MAGRLRAVPRAPRRARAALLDRVGGAAARPRARRNRDRARATCSARSLYRGCSGSPTSSGPRRTRRRDRRVRRFPVHGQRRQRRRLGAAARVPRRGVGRRSAGRLLRDRAGLGPAGLPVGRARSERLRVAAAASRPLRRRCSTASASITSSASTARSFANRTADALPSAGRTGAGRQGERLLTLFREQAAHHRRGSRHGARLRPRVARSPRHPGLEGDALGTRLEGGG